MSIREQWLSRVREGRLFKLSFLIPGPMERRAVLLHPELYRLVSGPWPDDRMAARCAALRAELERLLAGEVLNVCWAPFKGRSFHSIGRLDPPQDFLFDLRSLDRPGLRLFFHFAEKDVLIFHGCSPRSQPVPWLPRQPLGPRDSPQWRLAVTEANACWAELFSDTRPCEGETIDDLLSNAVVR